ncbi:MAG: PQQ-binding-like beta-propeller repeat protein [Actinomycetota bacterium]
MNLEGRHARGDHIPFWAAAGTVVVTALALLSLVADLGEAPREVALHAQDARVVPAGPINEGLPGLSTFRGNASRSFTGEGPVPMAPTIRWASPVDGSLLCGLSAEGVDGSDVKEWCGTGWTGQPNVVRAAAGFEVRIGAFDGAYHFLDAGSGREIRPVLPTGDLAKGSATTDPDGYPLYYAGSRDNLFRVVAMDRPEPTVLWTLDARTSVPRWVWNDDWDGAALVVGDHLFIGGENSWFYAIRLHRGYDEQGLVRVDPEVVAVEPGWDEELLGAIGDDDVSIESSVAMHDGVVYFANSGGLVQGWDVSAILSGGSTMQRVFRFWTGDDTDASVVIDEQGYLYVASEFQRFNERSRRVGQLMKLDPRTPADPLVWSVSASEIGFQGAGGSWSTPALYGRYVFFTSAAGRVFGVDRVSGRVAWEVQIGSPAIGSPVVVDGTLIQGDCSGHLYAWDVSDPTAPPPLLWSLDLGDCIESTPAVWRGWLYVGTREGSVYGIADEQTLAPA